MPKWKKMTVGDLCDTISDTYRGDDKEVVLINTSDVLEGKVLNHQVVENKNLKGQFKKTFKENDILYSEIRPANKRYAFVDFGDTDNYIASTKLMVLRPRKDVVHPRFLFSFLSSKSVLEELQQLAETRSGTFPQITFSSELAPTSINVPDLETQGRIVRILDVIERKISTNAEINKNLEHQAEAIFQSILSNAITTVNLGEIADVKGGKRLPKGVNLIDIPNAHPYIRVRDLNNVLFASLTPDYAYVDEETHKSISRYIVSTGDVLISIVGTIGLTAIVDSTLDKANLTENCVKVTNLKHITPEYLLLYLRSQLGREAITKGTVGAVQQKLPIKNIQAIPIPLLSEKNKNTLFCTLDSIFAEISSNVIQSAKLSSLRDTLLPRLMSGELNVSDIDL